jgi:hypothetical protein
VDPLLQLQMWLNSYGATGFLVSVDGGVDVPVGPNDWLTAVGSLAYLPAYGDRVHILHIDAASEEGEVMAVKVGKMRITFSYWWQDSQRALLDKWERDRVPLDVPALLQLALPRAA